MHIDNSEILCSIVRERRFEGPKTEPCAVLGQGRLLESFSCFMRNWPPMPEGDKVWVRAALKALVQGRAPAEAVDIADGELARFAALGAELGLPEPASKPAARVYP